jgi:hypothetical protein
MRVLNTRKDPLAAARAIEAAFDAAVETEEQYAFVLSNSPLEDQPVRIEPWNGDDPMSITSTTLNAVLKQLYDGQAVAQLAYQAKARPFLSRVKKITSFAGLNYPLPVVYDDVQGRSFLFTKAQANVTGGSMIQFAVDVVQNYSLAQITTDALLRSRNDKGAFLNGLKFAVDSAINRLANDLESAMFRDGSGKIGVISALGTPGNKVITLSSAEDIVNFAVGQKIVAAATTASSLRSSTASTIAAVDRDLGKITITENLTASCDGYVGDSLFTEGDYDSASDLNKVRGLDAWMPSSAPGSTSFFGVNRSVDPSRLGGVRYTGSASAIEESIVGGAARLGRECGATPDVAFMSFTTFRRLTNELGSKVQRDPGGKATAGFQSLEVYGPRGVIECVPCTFCQESTIWLLSSGTWMLLSMGDPLQVLEQDGNRILRMATSDALEVRVASFSQLACNAPGHNVRIAL